MMSKFITEREQKSGPNWLVIIFILIAIGLKLYILYFPFSFFDYLVTPGDDAVRHFEMITSILGGNFNTNYPWLFHLFIAFLTKVSGSNVIDVLKFVTPALVILPSIAVYLFLKRSFGSLPAIIGFVIILWASNYGLIAFGDGNYPNIIAGGFFLPLTLLFLLLSVEERHPSYYFSTAIFAVLTLLTHHLSAAYLFIVVVVYLIVLGIYNRYEKIAENYGRATLFVLILVVSAFLITSIFSFKQMFVDAYWSIIQSGSFSAGASFAKPIDFVEYAPQIGPLVYYGGLLGIIFIIYLLGHPKEKINKPALLLILVWFAVAFCFSRSSQVGLPGRFARELAMPLVLAEAVMLWRFLQAMRTNGQKIAGVFVIGLIVVLELTQINGGAYRSPDFFKKMIWFDEKDKVTAARLSAMTPDDAIILANNTTPYLPIFSGRKIIFIPADKTTNFETLSKYAKSKKARYLLVGRKTSSNPSGESYSFFANFDKITNNLHKILENCEQIETGDQNSMLFDLDDCTKKR